MKLASFFFGLFILLLSVQPSFSLSENSSDYEFVDNCEDDSKECENGCNPFLVCDSCIGYTVTMPNLFNWKLVGTKTLSIPQINPLVYQSVPDVFRPPQIG